jgi:hypothetical protein
MDNRINEIRRKVRLLRAQLLELEVLARNQVTHDLDCSEAAGRQLALRREMVELIGEWKAAGGGDRLPSPPDGPRTGKGKLARLGLRVLSAGARNLAERSGRSVA